MKKKIVSLILLALLVGAIVLEALPMGIKLQYLGGGESLGSYFDIYQFSVGLLGGFPAAILTCLLAALNVAEICTENKTLRGFIGALSILTVLLALWAMIFFFTVITACVVALLVAHTLLSIFGDNIKALR